MKACMKTLRRIWLLSVSFSLLSIYCYKSLPFFSLSCIEFEPYLLQAVSVYFVLLPVSELLK